MFKNLLRTPLLWAFALFLSTSSVTNSHTNSIGFVGEGAGTVSFWYGSWHSNTTFNEGSLQLVGSNGTSYGPVVTPFNLFSATVPTGLVAGTNYFQSNGTVLVPYGQAQTVSYVYQGVRFTNLQPGQYTFTYIPLGNPLSYNPTGTPTLDWQPQDNIILSSTVTLTAAIISPPGTPPTPAPTPTPPPAPVYSGPGTLDTIASVISSAYNQVHSYQYRVNSMLIALVNYDCNNFGEYRVCMSVAAKTNSVIDNGNDFAGVVTAAWMPIDEFRIGAFIEQTAGSNPTFGSVDFRSAEPLVGLFAVLQESRTNSGIKVRAAYSRSSDQLRITRETIGTSQPGHGQTNMFTVGYGLEASYGFELDSDWTLSPYVGLWRIISDRKAYSESGVDYPISYGNNSFNQTTMTTGLRLAGKLDDNISAVVGLGIERDVNVKQSDITGTSNVPGVENFALTMPTLSDSVRAVGSLGLVFDIGSNQSLVLQGLVRQTPAVNNYSNSDSINVTGLIKYTVGF